MRRLKELHEQNGDIWPSVIEILKANPIDIDMVWEYLERPFKGPFSGPEVIPLLPFIDPSDYEAAFENIPDAVYTQSDYCDFDSLDQEQIDALKPILCKKPKTIPQLLEYIDDEEIEPHYNELDRESKIVWLRYYTNEDLFAFMPDTLECFVGFHFETRAQIRQFVNAIQGNVAGLKVLCKIVESDDFDISFISVVNECIRTGFKKVPDMAYKAGCLDLLCSLSEKNQNVDVRDAIVVVNEIMNNNMVDFFPMAARAIFLITTAKQTFGGQYTMKLLLACQSKDVPMKIRRPVIESLAAIAEIVSSPDEIVPIIDAAIEILHDGGKSAVSAAAAFVILSQKISIPNVFYELVEELVKSEDYYTFNSIADALSRLLKPGMDVSAVVKPARIILFEEHKVFDGHSIVDVNLPGTSIFQYLSAFISLYPGEFSKEMGERLVSVINTCRSEMVQYIVPVVMRAIDGNLVQSASLHDLFTQKLSEESVQALLFNVLDGLNPSDFVGQLQDLYHESETPLLAINLLKCSVLIDHSLIQHIAECYPPDSRIEPMSMLLSNILKDPAYDDISISIMKAFSDGLINNKVKVTPPTKEAMQESMKLFVARNTDKEMMQYYAKAKSKQAKFAALIK